MENEKKYYFNKDNAAEMQARSAEARKRNRMINEMLKEALMQKVGDITRAEWLIRKALDNTEDSVSLKDVKLMQEILGESVTNLNVSSTDEKIEEIRKIFNGE